MSMKMDWLYCTRALSRNLHAFLPLSGWPMAVKLYRLAVVTGCASDFAAPSNSKMLSQVPEPEPAPGIE